MRSILDTRPKGAPGRDRPVPYDRIRGLVGATQSRPCSVRERRRFIGHGTPQGRPLHCGYGELQGDYREVLGFLL